jgi:ATP-dependent DNA ligase
VTQFKARKTHLCLRVGTGPAKSSGAAKFSNLLVQAMSQDDGERHAFFCFIGGISEHQTLKESNDTLEKQTMAKKKHITFPCTTRFKLIEPNIC